MKLDNYETLFKLRDAFSQPILSLSSSARLYELAKSKGSQNFLTKAADLGVCEKPIEITNKFSDEIKDKEGLIALLTCYTAPSYKRDDLLQEWIDKAPNKECKMQLSSLSAEPPPGAVGARDASTVALNESLFDGMSKLDTQDKEEAFLHLLGHDDFYSGIDAFLNFQYSPEDRQFLKELRERSLFGTRLSIQKKVGEYDSEGEYINAQYIEQACEEFEKYHVKTPDSIIFLMKYTGVPLDIVFKQQKIATTRREQRDLIDYILRGNNGILRQDNKGKPFLRATARTIVNKGKFASSIKDDKTKKAVEGLLSCALENCPHEKLSDLLLDTWYLSTEENTDLPTLVSKMLGNYGSVTVKLGQYLATRDIPEDWKFAFRNLSSKNEIADSTLIYDYETHTFGEASVLISFGEKIAEGSMAATYKGQIDPISTQGRLKGPIDVCVKIQHPFIETELDDDIKFIKTLIDYVNNNPELFNFSIPQNAHLVTKNRMQKEISVTQEAVNNDLLRTVLSHTSSSGITFVLPKHFPEATQGMFFTTEYIPGVELDKAEEINAIGMDSQEARNDTGLEVLRQIVTGVAQGDTNLGNFGACRLDSQTPAVVWYDTGHLLTLTNDKRKLLVKFIRDAIINPTNENIADSLNKMLTQEGQANGSYEKILGWMKGKNIGNAFSIDILENLFYDFTGFVAKENLEIEDTWVSLMNTLALLKPLIHDCPKTKLISTLGPALLAA